MDHHVNALLMAVHKGTRRGFEKPTARLYYKKIAEDVPNLRVFKWQRMRDKMRNLRSKYRSAVDWRNNAGAELTGDEQEQTIRDNILKLCPQFDLIDAIFGCKASSQPFFVPDSDGNTLTDGDSRTGETIMEESGDFMDNYYEEGSCEQWAEAPSPIVSLKVGSSWSETGDSLPKELPRKRNCEQYYRWSEEAVNALLKTISRDPCMLEKPTARVYYTKIADTVHVLQDCEWKAMRDKMRQMKIKYRAAVDWWINTGSRLTGAEAGPTIRDKMLKLCPQFDLLEPICGGTASIQPSFVPDTNRSDHSGDVGTEEVFTEGYDIVMVNCEEELSEERAEPASPSASPNISSFQSETSNYLPNSEGQLTENLSGTETKCRIRRKEIMRWSDEQVDALLMAVSEDLRSFEKPYARRYYSTMAMNVPLLRDFEWRNMRDKMRNLKVKYRSAIDWYNKTGAKLTGNKREQTIRDNMLKLCPQFDLLEPICGGTASVQPSFVPDTDSGDISTEEVATEGCENVRADCEDAVSRQQAEPASPSGTETKCRIRRKEIMRWSDEQVDALLMAVSEDLRSFEKPCARRYYSTMAMNVPLLRDFEWRNMRDKMKNLKVKYRSAVDWRNNMGAVVTGGNKEETVRDKMLKLCPQFDLLEPICGGTTSVQPSFVPDTDRSDHSGDVGTEEVVTEGYDIVMVNCEEELSEERAEPASPSASPNISSSQSETSNYQTEFEAHLTENLSGTEPKCRIRRKEMMRWSEEEVDALLMAVSKDLRSFEKPYARGYYSTMAKKVPLLRDFKWWNMRDKMKNLKLKYRSAVSWRDKTGAKLTGNKREQTIRDYMLKLCPQFDLLDPIYGSRVSIQPSFVPDADRSDHSGDVCSEEAAKSDEPIETCEGGTDEQRAETPSPTLASPDVGSSRSETPNSQDTFTQQVTNEPAGAGETSTKGEGTESSSITSLSQMDKDRLAREKELELEYRKVELEREKFRWQREKEQKELQLEQKRLDIEKDKMREEIRLKEKMMEGELALKKEEMKYKLELEKWKIEKGFLT